MGVYIKEMQMPKRCVVCRFVDWSNLHQTVCCELKDYKPCFSDHSIEYRTQRSTICPLVDIGKYDRLIDAGELKKEFPKDTDWEYPVNTNQYVCEMIDKAKTVIEAEGE
jgi:hypothetical protein